MPNKILLVEDEEVLANSLIAYLQRDNFSVQWLADGAEVLTAFEQRQPDLVLLDLMLPNVDGITLCRKIREKSSVPIIMVTARVDEIDRLLGLEIGADDYICKPYSPREVVARAKAVLRRFGSNKQIVEEPDKTQANILRIDEATMDAYWGGVALGLTALEFRLLHMLAREPQRIFTRAQLMDKIYHDHRVVSDRTIDSHINKLRRKFEVFGNSQEIIRSVYGAGYSFEQP